MLGAAMLMVVHRYILQSPNCWHLFSNPHYPNYYGKARFEEPETLR